MRWCRRLAGGHAGGGGPRGLVALSPRPGAGASGASGRSHASDRAALLRAGRLGPYALRLAWLSHGLLQVRLERVDGVRAAAEMLQKIANDHSMQQALGPALYLRGWARARTGDMAGHADLLAGGAVDEQLHAPWPHGGADVYGRCAAASEALVGRAGSDRRAFALAERTGERLYLIFGCCVETEQLGRATKRAPYRH